MEIKRQKLPLISIATPIYNGERNIEKYLSCIFAQDYPLNRLEVILNDAGSVDKTLEIVKKYMKKYPKNIRLMHNPKKVTEGSGMGNDQVTRAVKGDIIVIMDQDNILIQKNWISSMVKILIENPDINGVQSRMLIPQDGTILDKYLNAIGIEDPFAIPYSLNAQIVFNPKKFEYNLNGDFYIYNCSLDNFLYAGANGFVIRKRDFFEAGGYVQDTENFYRFALKHYKIAVPKNVRLHHQTSKELVHFLKKRIYFVMYYLLNNYKDRNFYWFNLKKNPFIWNLKFINNVIFNLLFIPGLIQAIRMVIKDKKTYWFIHPIILWLMTMGYVYAELYTRIFKKIGISYGH